MDEVQEAVTEVEPNREIKAYKGDGSPWLVFDKRHPMQPDAVKVSRHERRKIIARAKRAAR